MYIIPWCSKLSYFDLCSLATLFELLLFCYYKVFNKLYDPFPSLQYFHKLNSIKSIHGLLLSTVTTKIDWILKFCYLHFLITPIFAQLLQSHESKLKKIIPEIQLNMRSAWFAFSDESLHFLKIKWISFLHSSRQYLISDAKKLIEYPNWTHNEIIWFNLLINSYKIGSIQVYFWRAFSWSNMNLLQRIWLSAN